jgi:hypothetical protein
MISKHDNYKNMLKPQSNLKKKNTDYNLYNKFRKKDQKLKTGYFFLETLYKNLAQ